LTSKASMDKHEEITGINKCEKCGKSTNYDDDLVGCSICGARVCSDCLNEQVCTTCQQVK